MKYKTSWDLKLLYTSITDPKLEKDMRAMEAAYKAFEKKYKTNTSFLLDEKKLATALRDFETLTDKVGSMKPYIFAYLSKDINSSDEKVQALLNVLFERLTLAANRIVFFPLALAKIPKPLQKKYITSKHLTHFHYFLKTVFDCAQYNLSESEEKILNLTSMSARELWIRGVEQVLNKKQVMYKGKPLPLSAAFNQLRTLPTKERYELHDKAIAALKEASDFGTSEINAVYLQKKITDELRGFKNPYDQTLLDHQISEKTLAQLRKSIAKWRHVSHDFYALKAKFLKLDSLRYPDRFVSIGEKQKKISFEQSVEVLTKSFSKLGAWYATTFNSFLNRGQVDVFPKQGKTSGAYCLGSLNMPTFVLLNNLEDFNSVMTFAHEMGHAFHSELSKKQSPIYVKYSTAVAEVASTLFESIVFDDMLEKLTKKEQIVALHDRISDDVQTIFRQIACFNFELELHKSIRSKGSVAKEEIAGLLNKHMQSYLGPVFKLVPDDGYFFISWSHIRNFFYVYSYAYGQIISKALYKKYKADKKFFSKIEQFLSAGGSKSPEDIFKDIGIDTSDPAFFELGLKSIAEDLKKLQTLAKEEKLI